MNTSNTGMAAWLENPETFLASFESNFNRGEVGRELAAYAADAGLNLGEGKDNKWRQLLNLPPGAATKPA